MSFYRYGIGDREYLRSGLFPKEKVSHGFTSALGGVSRGVIKGFNLGFRVNDDEYAVKENYRILADDLGLDLEKTVLAKQTHTDNIRTVTADDCGKGIVRDSDIVDTDGLICNIPGITLVVFSADCVPILLYDDKKSAIAAIHSGWRGSVKEISLKAVKKMQAEYGSDPKEIRAAIGPCIGSCCFEFGSEALDYFDERYLKAVDTENSKILNSKSGKYMVDIASFCKDTLQNAGLTEENIDLSGVCTACNSHKYYSYRTHKDKTGRQAAVIMLKS